MQEETNGINRDDLRTLHRVYDLVTMHASPNAFYNGVTDSTGMVDEGDCHAGTVIDELRTLIIRLERA